MANRASPVRILRRRADRAARMSTNRTRNLVNVAPLSQSLQQRTTWKTRPIMGRDYFFLPLIMNDCEAAPWRRRKRKNTQARASLSARSRANWGKAAGAVTNLTHGSYLLTGLAKILRRVRRLLQPIGARPRQSVLQGRCPRDQACIVARRARIERLAHPRRRSSPVRNLRVREAEIAPHSAGVIEPPDSRLPIP